MNHIKVLDLLVNKYYKLKILRHYFKYLFENKKNNKILDQTSQSFFNFLNIIFIDYFFLECCKITDPYKQRNNLNLTIEYFIEEGIEELESEKEELNKIYNKIIKFREKINKARNKIIAHYDIKILFEKKVLGKFKKREDIEFLENLYNFLNIIHLKLKNEELVELNCNNKFDVESLINYLGWGIGFQEMLLIEKNKSYCKEIEKYKVFAWKDNY